MKTKIGELKGKPLILCPHEDDVTKNELVVSVNNANDKIKDIKRRLGDELISILDIDSSEGGSALDYVIFKFSEGSEYLERSDVKVNCALTVPKPPEVSEALFRSLANPCYFEIFINTPANPKLLEYIQNYKNYLSTNRDVKQIKENTVLELPSLNRIRAYFKVEKTNIYGMCNFNFYPD